MRFAVLQFPGSNCDQDCVHVLGNVLGQQADYLWHKEESLGNTDAVVVPGGFSYGDCLLYTSPSPRDVEESRMPSSA